MAAATKEPDYASLFEEMVLRMPPTVHYTYGHRLGEGAFGEVYEATHKKSGLRVAVKLSKPGASWAALNAARREAVVMKDVRMRMELLFLVLGAQKYTSVPHSWHGSMTRVSNEWWKDARAGECWRRNVLERRLVLRVAFTDTKHRTGCIDDTTHCR